MADEDDDDEGLATPRPFWSGTIAFGLVSLPVSLFPGNRGRALSLKMVDADGTPLQRRYFCEKEGKALSAEDIVRGYEVEEGNYVLVEDEELEALSPEKSREIDLRRFVRLEDIDPAYFERAYFLVPDEGATKAYRLLAKSMEDEQRAGIASFVMRGKEYLCAIVAEKGILRAETLRFHDELRDPEGVGLPARGKVSRDSVKRLQQAMRKLSAKSFDREELRDEYVQRMLRHVKKKLASGKDVVKAPEEVAEEVAAESNVVDLMQVLKERLQGRGGTGEERRGATGEGGREGASGRRSVRAKDEEPASARRKSTQHRQKRAATPSSGRSRKAADDLEALPKAELYERAQARDIPGRSGMSKEQLIAALTSH